MTEDQTIARENLMDAVTTLGINPSEVSMIYLDSHMVEVYYIKPVADQKGKIYDEFKVI